jgi:uncharacterized membrane protein YeaQ/YmgE (transglycosylase-associated protein family)
MGSALSALLYLGVGAGSALVATTMRRRAHKNAKRTFIGNMVVGSTGAWLGATLFGPIGPTLYGVSLLATAASSAASVLGYNILSKNADTKEEREQES